MKTACIHFMLPILCKALAARGAANNERGEMSTMTLNIGELMLDVQSTDLTACRVDRAVACDFEVEVDFTYKPGHPGNLWGRWEDAEEPIPPTVEINSIKPEAALHFEGDVSEVIIKRGTDIKDLFSGREVSALEDRIYAEIQSA